MVQLGVTPFPSLPLHILTHLVLKRDLTLLRQAKKGTLGFHSYFSPFLRGCGVLLLWLEKKSPKTLKLRFRVIAVTLVLSLVGQGLCSASSLL